MKNVRQETLFASSAKLPNGETVSVGDVVFAGGYYSTFTRIIEIEGVLSLEKAPAPWMCELSISSFLSQGGKIKKATQKSIFLYCREMNKIRGDYGWKLSDFLELFRK